MDSPRSCQFQHLDWEGGRGGCCARFFWGGVFHFLKDGRARGLGDHDFSFSFGGRVCFSFRVGGFKSLNIYFWLLEV